MTKLPFYNELTIAIRAALYGWRHPTVLHMRMRNAQKPQGAARG